MDHVEGPLHILLVGKEGQPYLTSYVSSFSLFFNLKKIDIGEEGKESMMDYLEKRGRIMGGH